MRICASCGRQNTDETDFCACGEYLRWEPTRSTPAVAAPAASGSDGPGSAGAQASGTGDPRAAQEALDPNVTVAPDVVAPGGGGWEGATADPEGSDSAGAGEPPPGAAALTLRPPGDDGAAEGVVSPSVEPGERVTLLGLIRNQSDVVDNFDLTVRGLPKDWWTIAPATAYLVPYGSSGTFEQKFQIHIHPPRAPDAQARAWSFEVVAASRAYGGEVASAPASVTIGAYFEVATELRPERASGRLKARYRLVVRNRANARTEVVLSAEDTDAECRFRFAEPSIALEPGNAIECPFTVFPPSQIWVGKPHERRFQVTAASVGVDQPQPPRVAAFRQRPWLPWWLAIVVPVAVALAVLVLKALPKQAVVPNVKGQANVWLAEKLLTKSGFRVIQKPGAVPDASKRAGSIADQNPSPGAKAKRGAVVTVEVYGRSGAKATVPVPRVVGDQAAVAIQAVIASGLTAGAVSPQPPNPNGKIVSQYPFAGTPEPKGTPVNLFLAPLKHGAKEQTKGNVAAVVSPAAAAAAAGAAGAAAAANGVATPAAVKAAAAEAGKGTIAIPTLPPDPSSAAAQLSQLGLVPQPLKQHATAPVGMIAGSVPAAGAKVAKGATIDLLISSGSPPLAAPLLAYDNGQTIQVIDPPSIKPVLQVLGVEAAWSPDGTQLVYTQNANGALILRPANARGAPITVDQPASGSFDRDPAFAPKFVAKTITIAFIERDPQGSKLCFLTYRTAAVGRSCTAASSWDLGRQVDWSPDGLTILVIGKQKVGSHKFGVLAFNSSVPYSGEASNWSQPTVQGALSNPTQRGILAAAFSPGRDHMALVSNIGASNSYDYRLYITPFGNYNPIATGKRLDNACQVSWRSDGKELAVMQPYGPCGTSTTTGTIIGLDLSNPTSTPTLATNAAHPAWQPVPTGG